MKLSKDVKNNDIETRIRALIGTIAENCYTPTSVYRLQFNKNFGFKDATQIIPYLSQLGVDTVYSSPFFKALPGSLHGYDVVDSSQLNEELGSEEDFVNFCQTLKKYGMGQIADIVPNHMGILGTKNPWWMDVLENGEDSIYARFFDIDWNTEKKQLRHKVLLPILGDHYGQVLADKQIQLEYNPVLKGFFIRYWEHQLPITPKSYYLILEYGIHEVSRRAEESDGNALELLSIITAMKNLAERVQKDSLKLIERNREKNIAKDRLAHLIEASPWVKDYVESRLQIFNGASPQENHFDLLHELLGAQKYRLAYWRVASEEINYRRFFDVNSLAAIRVENPQTFDRYHALIFHLMSQGWVQGLRIDHTDGLYNPVEYLKKIQQVHMKRMVIHHLMEDQSLKGSNLIAQKKYKDVLEKILSEDEHQNRMSIYLVIEKILESREEMPKGWLAHGTVGYDYLSALNGFFINEDHEEELTSIYEEFTGWNEDYNELIYEKKKFFALINMASQINNLGHRLDSISEANPYFRDFTLNNLTLAIREVIASFPVYRTYISPQDGQVSETDARYIHIAVEKAKQKTPALNPAIYDFLEAILTMKFDRVASSEEKKLYRDFVFRFQQITGPIMAKGLEDTVFYLYNRFISVNEVGCSPLRFGQSIKEFHKQNMDRNKNWPKSFITGMTHDAKRSEDMRLRLNVLSELPRQWKLIVARWSIYNKDYKTLLENELMPSANTEYYLYQTLIGLWPLHLNSVKKCTINQMEKLNERIWSILEKSIREAKNETSWIHPNKPYEACVKKFLVSILTPGPKNRFLKSFVEWVSFISDIGILNSISATILKIGSPGVVDIYQGSEMWDFRSVDPDNRRPVNYEEKKACAEHIHQLDRAKQDTDLIQQLFAERANGNLKLYLLKKGLSFRRENKALFVGGDYKSLQVRGKQENRCIAFFRKKNNVFALVIASRFHAESVLKHKGFHLGKKTWRGAMVIIPHQFKNYVFRDLYTNERLRPERNRKGVWFIPVWRILNTLPATILYSES